MRLSRFQQEEEWKEKEGKKGGKVHPSGGDADCGAGKGGRGKLTRYSQNP